MHLFARLAGRRCDGAPEKRNGRNGFGPSNLCNVQRVWHEVGSETPRRNPWPRWDVFSRRFPAVRPSQLEQQRRETTTAGVSFAVLSAGNYVSRSAPGLSLARAYLGLDAAATARGPSIVLRGKCAGTSLKHAERRTSRVLTTNADICCCLPWLSFTFFF